MFSFVVLHCFLSVGTACEFWFFCLPIPYMSYYSNFLVGSPMDMTELFKFSFLCLVVIAWWCKMACKMWMRRRRGIMGSNDIESDFCGRIVNYLLAYSAILSTS